MINDNIVITIVEAKNGSVKIAIEADKDVKIYREEIYYQITSVNNVDSVTNLLKEDKTKINNKVEATPEAGEVVVDKPEKSKTFIIKKKNPEN